MKRCSASPAIREIPVKTTMRYHYRTIRMSKIKKKPNVIPPNAFENAKKLLHSDFAGENVNGTATLENHLAVFPEC